MATKKNTLYLSEALQKIIGNYDSFAGRVGSMLTRYHNIVERECPELTIPEWSAICDVLNGCWLQAECGETDPVRFIWAEISDGDRLDGLGEKWKIDAQDLARRVQSMRYSEQCAIVEVATRFWKSPKLNEISTKELLKEAGAKIAK